MRASLVAGIVLIALGAFVLLRGGSFTTREKLLEVGDVKVTADQKRAVPPWLGWVAVVAGTALIVAGARKGGTA
jgi:hypothetical protein